MITVVTPLKIIEESCRQHSIRPGDFFGPSLRSWCVSARRLAARRMREELKMSYPEIGLYIDRHYSSVMNLLGVTKTKKEHKKREGAAV